MNRWKRWGIAFGCVHMLAGLALYLLRGRWGYEGTVWYQALEKADYLPSLLQQTLLSILGIPHLYDVPLTRYETYAIGISSILIGFAWWFLIGAAAATIVARLRLIKSSDSA